MTVFTNRFCINDCIRLSFVHEPLYSLTRFSLATGKDRYYTTISKPNNIQTNTYISSSKPSNKSRKNDKSLKKVPQSTHRVCVSDDQRQADIREIVSQVLTLLQPIHKEYKKELKFDHENKLAKKTVKFIVNF